MNLGSITFVSPWMLAGMAMAVLPLAAHLLSRRTRRRIVFPTVRLLSESAASTSRLYRLRRWVVLLLRCAAVAAITLAFARPVWTSGELRPAGAKGTAVVLVVDTSASCSQQADGVSLVHSLRAVAERALGSLDGGTDRAGVVWAAARPQAVLPELSYNLEVLRKEVRRLEPTHERANLSEAIALAGQLLAKHDGQRRVVILSDMQRSNWSDVALGPSALPPGTRLTVLPVGSGEPDNVTLCQPRAVPIRPLVGQPMRLAVRVANHSPAARAVAVTARLDGRELGSLTVEAVPPYGSLEAAFPATLPAPGEHRVVFSIPPDALADDNMAFLTVEAVRRVPVVVVGDEEPDRPGTGSYFLIRALAPRGDAGDDVEVRHMPGSELAYSRIADAEAVYVSFVGPLTERALAALRQYANQGGGVAVFCGEGPVAENLQALQSLAKDVTVLPWQPVAPRDLSREGGFLQLGAAWEAAGPLADFDDASRQALQQIRFLRVWQTRATDGKAADLLRYTDGTPAMSARPVGPGKLLVCNFSPSLQASDLGKYGTFVALTQAMLHYLRPQRTAAESLVGQPFCLPVRLPEGASPKNLTGLGPDGRACRVEPFGQADERRLMVNLPDPKIPGFHQVLIDGRPAATAALNLDPREGDLRRTDLGLLGKQLAGGDERNLEVLDGRAAWSDLHPGGRALWPWFVLAAMAAIGLELGLLSLWKR